LAPLIVELLGTLLLVLTIELSDSGKNPALSIGFALMVIVFWGGSISGGHYNPAVTLGVLFTMRKKVEIVMSLFYILAQVTGSFIGAFIAYGIKGSVSQGPTIGKDYDIGSALAIEFIWTTLLVSVVINVSTTKAHANNSFYGLAIGSTVFVGASIAGPISGGAFNPAVGTGPKVVWYATQKGNVTEPFDKNMWIYWVAPLMASVFAALVFRIIHVGEYEKTHPLTINDEHTEVSSFL